MRSSLLDISSFGPRALWMNSASPTSPLWPSLSARLLHLLRQAYYIRSTEILPDPLTKLCFLVQGCVHLDSGEHPPNLPRNVLWVSNGFSYSPGPSLNWEILERRSCWALLCTLTEDSHSRPASWSMILAEWPEPFPSANEGAWCFPSSPPWCTCMSCSHSLCHSESGCFNYFPFLSPLPPPGVGVHLVS